MNCHININHFWESKIVKSKSFNFKWVYGSSVDPRDNTIYHARVDANDYDTFEDALYAASFRSFQLANRGNDISKSI